MKDELINRAEEFTTSLNEAKKKFYSDNFYEFNEQVLQWPDIYEPLHRRVCDFIQNNIDSKKILLLLPRGTFKSSIVTVGYTLWTIGKDPSARIMIGNATYPMATQFLSQVKNHLSRNQTYKDIFGDFSANSDGWREDKIYVSREKSYEQKEPTVWANGIGSNQVGSHVDIAILDDLVARENIGTKDQIEKVKTYYKDVLDLIDAKNGHKRVILIGTTWHWDDLYAWIQDPDNDFLNDFAVLRLPAYEGEWGEGKLLFPKKLSWSILADLKRQQGSAHFSAQYMLDPIPEENQTFKAPFKKYEETDLRGIELKKFVTVDPAISEKKDADYSAMICVGVDKNNTWYILDIWREHALPKALIDQIFYWNQKWKPISIGIETNAFQKSLKYYIGDEMKLRNEFIPIKELGHTDLSKDERIKGLQPRYEIGSVFHPQRQSVPLISFLEDELLRFPLGKNDDMIDALASQLELAFPPRKRDERNSPHRNHYPA